MSRKFIDDHVELRLILNNGVGFDHLPAQANQYFECGHMCLDPISGLRFRNEGASDRNSSLFVSDQYNALILHDKLETLPLTAPNQSASFNTAFNLVGTNAADSTAAFNTTAGGVTLTTTTTTNDQVILSPNTNSIWGNVNVIADNQVVFETQLVTGSNITAAIIWAGMKLTNTSTTATDNDQTFIRYQNTVNSGKWQIIDSTNNVDNAQDSGVTVVVSTAYLLQIRVGADLKPRYYINGILVGTGAALRTGQNMHPYVGVQTTTTAAKAITVRYERVVLPRIPIA
jgi:hypothetical protein